jgi:hypothetical protein
MHTDLIRIDIELFHGERMSDTKPVRCQKCGKPLGYITVFAKGLVLSQPIQNAKIVAICIECFQKGK